MKNSITLLLFLLFSFAAKCDTLDYWSVYLNDRLLGNYNAVSKDLTIKLNRSELKSTDLISLRYGSDHPCYKCVTGINVLVDDLKRKLPEVRSTETFPLLSIPAKEILELIETEGVHKFAFNYFEEHTINGIKQNYGRVVFVLDLSESTKSKNPPK